MDETAAIEGRRSKRLKRDSKPSSHSHPGEGSAKRSGSDENESKDLSASAPTNDATEEEDILEDDLCPICRLLLCNPLV
jgi:hypothetical protein